MAACMIPSTLGTPTKIIQESEPTMSAPQNFRNHTRWDPIYHFFVLPVLLLNIIVSGIWYGRHYYQHIHTGMWLILVSIVLFIAALKIRTYVVKLQDRIIRLEERMRLAALVTPSELVELESLTTSQLIALRFASNPELPDLARRAIRENLNRKRIKESIVSWRADNERV
jgi:hypothetical protein